MANTSRAYFEGKRILVADGEVLVAAMLRTDLEELGFAAVDVVHSLEAALQSARSLPPDILLLDLHLMGGHVDTLLMFTSIPLVLMSGDPASAPGGPGPAAPVIRKPFTPATLEEALARVIGANSPG